MRAVPQEDASHVSTARKQVKSGQVRGGLVARQDQHAGLVLWPRARDLEPLLATSDVLHCAPLPWSCGRNLKVSPWLLTLDHIPHFACLQNSTERGPFCSLEVLQRQAHFAQAVVQPTDQVCGCCCGVLSATFLLRLLCHGLLHFFLQQHSTLQLVLLVHIPSLHQSPLQGWQHLTGLCIRYASLRELRARASRANTTREICMPANVDNCSRLLTIVDVCASVYSRMFAIVRVCNPNA